MIDKIVAALGASVRDIVLAGVAAFAGVIIAAEVVPGNSLEWKALLSAALYAALRAMVAFVLGLLKA